MSSGGAPRRDNTRDTMSGLDADLVGVPLLLSVPLVISEPDTFVVSGAGHSCSRLVCLGKDGLSCQSRNAER
jgi:hypothetical protein